MRKNLNPIKQVFKEMSKEEKLLNKEIARLKGDIITKQNDLTSKVKQLKTLKNILSNIELKDNIEVNSSVRKTVNNKDKLIETRKKLSTRATRIKKKDLIKYRQKTIIATIIEMLKDEPLHYREIINRLRILGFPLDGKQPEANMVALLSRDERFIRVDKGIYKINEQNIEHIS